jgi:hypothetical protein
MGHARVKAALGSITFLVLVPGTVAGLIPWHLTGWRSSDPPVTVGVVGAVLIAAGVGVLLHAFARFVIEGSAPRLPWRRPRALWSAASTATCATSCI